MALEECKNRVWHKKFFFPRLLKLLPFSNKNCWCCISILLYFRKYQELNKSLLHNFFSPSMLPFFLCFIFFFQPEGPRLFMWKDVAKLNMACFNSRISFPWQVGGKKWRETFFYRYTLFPIKGFFVLCKEKNILKKNHQWPVDPVFK